MIEETLIAVFGVVAVCLIVALGVRVAEPRADIGCTHVQVEKAPTAVYGYGWG